MSETRLWAYFQDVYCRQSGLVSAESRADYEIQVGHFYRWWGLTHSIFEPPAITDLTRARILEARDWKQRPRAAGGDGSAIATANHFKRVLTALANHAADAGLMPFPGRMRNLKEPEREPRAWSLGDYARIIATAGELVGEHQGIPLADLCPCFYRVAYDSAARIGTLLSIRWDWIGLGDAELEVPASATKDKSAIVVELSRATVDALCQLAVYRIRSRSDLVFGTWVESTFRRLHKRIVYAALIDPTCDLATLRGQARVKAERAVNRANCFHKIRRTTATEITAVAGEAVASKALGHSCLAVTRRYLDRRRLKQTVQASQRPEIPTLPPLRILGGIGKE